MNGIKKVSQVLLYRVVSLFLVLAVSSCQTGSKKSEQTSNEPVDFSQISIIDAHSHTTPNPELRDQKFTDAQIASAYLKEMREAGVAASVAHSYDMSKGYIPLEKENVTHCAGVRQKIDLRAIENGLKSGKFKCVKIYLGYVYRYAYDSEYKKIYRIAAKYQVPVVFHTGDTYDANGKLKYADPLTIDEVAVEFRNVNFVIAHCGYPWIESGAEVAYKNANVFLDTSAFLIGDISKLPPAQVEEYVVKPLKWVFGYLENPEKLMFGTDYPLSRVRPYLEAVKHAIPPQHWKAVFHDNAARVFKIN